MAAKEFAAIATSPSGATTAVAATTAAFIAAFSKATGAESFAAFRTTRRDRRSRSSARSERTGSRTSRARPSRSAVTASASAVPSAAPATPSPAPGSRSANPDGSVHSRAGKISSRLNRTFSAHICMLSEPGVRMSPLAWSAAVESAPSCRKGTPAMQMAKYRAARSAVPPLPPSQPGSQGDTAAPAAASASDRHPSTARPWRSTDRASASRPAPTAWAIWTENPTTPAQHTPPNSHTDEAIRPTAAASAVPSRPIIAASMKDIAMDANSAIIAGTLIRRTSASFAPAGTGSAPRSIADRDAAASGCLFVPDIRVAGRGGGRAGRWRRGSSARCGRCRR